ncbi:MAG: hypothetical protein ACK4SN_13005, partial [Bellilinea sp.]
MKRITNFLLLISLLAGVLSACAQPTPAAPRELRILTHDSFAASEEVIRAFERENN